MNEKYLIGVDLGSQSAKVAIFDLDGNVVSEGKERLRPTNLPAPGKVEHPDDDLWDSVAAASREAMTQFTGHPESIAGIGLCTIRFCRALLKEDGTLAAPVMSWMDERVSQPYEHTQPDVKYVTTSSGYITHRFTGEFRDTAANYQGMWPIDTDTWDWSESDRIIDEFKIPREMLFTLQNPGTVLGRVTKSAAEVTGIPENIPVVATANDKAVEALGSGTLSENTALVSLGTYIAGMIHGKTNPKNVNHFWTNFADMPYEYLYESNGIRRGMWTVSWFKELLGKELVKKADQLGMSPEEYLDMEAQENVPAGSDGLMTVLDWLAPPDQPFKKGMMIGFDGRHTRAHIYRSILEAIALTMKTHVEAMCKELDADLKDIVITGGGSNGDLMMQIFADVFGLPAKRNVINGAASLGASMNAAVGLELYSSYEEAIEHMVKIRDTFHPESDTHEFYDQLNKEVFQQITASTDGVLKRSYDLFRSWDSKS